MEPDAGTGALLSQDRTGRMRGCFLWVWLFRWNLPLASHKGFRMLLNSVKQWQGFQRTDSNSEGSATGTKMLLNSLACYREIVHERKSSSTQQTSLLSYLKKWPQPAPTSAVSSCHPDQSASFNNEARRSTSKKVTT